MIRVLFVCLGNICRSPMAQAIFESEVRSQKLEDKIFADSCGTGHWHIGEPPDYRTQTILSENNIDFEHFCRIIIPQDFRNFNYILGMDEQNIRDINKIKPADNISKIFLFREFDKEGENINVPDPYWGGKNDFREVFNIVSRVSFSFLNYLKKQHNLK